MLNYFRGTRRAALTICGLLLLSGAVAFAQHNRSLTRIFAAPANAALAIVHTDDPQTPNNRPLVKLFLNGAIEREGKQIAVETAGPVRPGEVVSFTMSSVNDGSAPARQYRAVGQIPRGTILVPNSAMGDGSTQVSYSIDDGKEFSSIPLIDEKQPDGTIRKVAAPVSMYTQVRFEWADPLGPGGKLVTSYQVRVK